MTDHLDTAFRAAASALRDVVTPAVDPANPLAREQLQLVIGWLDFARERLPFLHDRNRFELSAHAGMGDAVLAALGEGGDAGLSMAIDHARKILSDAAAGTAAIVAAANRLQDSIAAVVRRAADLPAETCRAVEKSIVVHSKCILDAQRVWFLPQSVEPEPDKMPSLQEVLLIAADRD
jgi:hypothetical protein